MDKKNKGLTRRFNYNQVTIDNSAFDVAVEILVEGKLGLIGIECKYTE